MDERVKRQAGRVGICLVLWMGMTASAVSPGEPSAAVLFDVAPARGYSSLLGSHDEATLQFTLHEIAGHPVLLQPPVLARMVLKEEAAGEAGLQALAQARFLDPQGQRLDAPFLLERRRTLPLRLELSGLPGPGRYEGTIRISAEDAPAVDVPFVLLLRERPIIAFILISLGVVLSFFVRKYASHERPRMVLQHRVLRLTQVLEALKDSQDASARARELVGVVAQEANTLLTELSGQPVGLGRTGERIELLERKVACTRNWLRLSKAVDDMRPASLRAEPRAKLAQGERLLRDSGATAQDLSAIEAVLSGLPSELDEAMRQYLTERLAAFRAQLAPMTQDPASAQARQIALRVTPRLDKAEALLGQDPKAAFEELEVARLAQASILSDRQAAEPGTAEPGMVTFSSLEGLEDRPSPPGEPIPPWLFEGVQLFVPTLEGRPPAEGLAQLQRRLASLDLFILALVLGGAALAGLKLLWVGAPVWGSLDDQLIAFMWGFGLHQVCHPGLAGVLGRGQHRE